MHVVVFVFVNAYLCIMYMYGNWKFSYADIEVSLKNDFFSFLIFIKMLTMGILAFYLKVDHKD